MYIFDLHVCIMQIWAPFTALDNRWHLFRETLSGGSTLSYPKSLRSSSPSMCIGEYHFLTTCSCSFDSLDVNFSKFCNKQTFTYYANISKSKQKSSNLERKILI